MRIPKTQLGEVCEIIMGQSPPSSTYNMSGLGLPFFQGKADFGDIFPKARTFCSEPVRIAERGDVLISVRAPVGPTNLAPRTCCIGRGLSALRPKSKIDTLFLLYFMRHYEPRLAYRGLGSTFSAINRDDLEDILIPLPGLSEQGRITQQLEKTNRLQRMRRHSLQMCDEFLHAIFLQMFGDPMSSQARWARAPIGDFASVQTGKTPPRPDPTNYGDHIEWIKSDNITLKQLHPTPAAEKLSAKGLSLGRSVPAGSILMTCIAGSLNSIGNVAVTNRTVSFNQQINAITPGPDVDVLYLYGLLRVAKPLIQGGATEAMKKMITKSKLEEILLPIPPLPLQKRFGSVLKIYLQYYATQVEALRQTDHLFRTFLQRAFSER
jgi:type I restriction enzyme S subunit